MLVDDDECIRDAFTEVLRDEGFQVRGYRSGQEALEALKNCETPNLILLDWMMPGMSGQEFIQSDSASAAAKTLPVVVISAVAEKIGAIPGIRGCVKKPVDIEELLRTVRFYCGQSAA